MQEDLVTSSVSGPDEAIPDADDEVDWPHLDQGPNERRVIVSRSSRSVVAIPYSSFLATASRRRIRL